MCKSEVQIFKKGMWLGHTPQEAYNGEWIQQHQRTRLTIKDNNTQYLCKRIYDSVI